MGTHRSSAYSTSQLPRDSGFKFAELITMSSVFHPRACRPRFSPRFAENPQKGGSGYTCLCRATPHRTGLLGLLRERSCHGLGSAPHFFHKRFRDTGPGVLSDSTRHDREGQMLPPQVSRGGSRCLRQEGWIWTAQPGHLQASSSSEVSAAA